MTSQWIAENDADIIERLSDVEFETPEDITDAVLQVGRLRAITDAAKKALSGQERHLASLMRKLNLRDFRVEGVADVHVSAAKKKPRYQSGRLAHVVAGYIADTPCDSDGVALPPGALCHKVADELVDVFGLNAPSKGFNVTPVRDRGLDPDDFVDYEWGDDTIRWTAAS